MNKLAEIILLLSFCIPYGCKGESRQTNETADERESAPINTLDYRMIQAKQGNVSQSGKTVWFHDPWLQMDAFSIVAPAGWKAACDIVWDFGNAAIPCRFWLKAANDENLGFEIFPGDNFTWTQFALQTKGRGANYMGSTVMEPFSAVDFLQRMVIPRFRSSMKQLQVVSVKPLPEEAQKLSRQLSQQANIQADAAEVAVSYIDNAGVEILEKFVCTLGYFQRNDGIIWWTEAVMSTKGPRNLSESKREEALHVLATLAPNPQWVTRRFNVQESIKQSTSGAIVGAREAASRYAQQGARASEQRSSYFEERMASSERISKGWDDVRMGNERFITPSGEEKVVQTYRAKGWINGLGQTVYTDQNSLYNPNFDPNLTGDFEQMRIK